ncbi:BTB/POZ domain containing protein [Tritrichomonas foetus]|uniref:BTB/POZ domain containing protein n=1 Tax=Tritrichomonas foetus TaxID=1144522 RepID=A0A1J4JKQ5_9EUKA|nr:BTB/POZ domain containing protein [Tritrichomonas foetus]|eukprot:OHS99666.1 BTB/POZ domain containing protein [Tritrichomonas foetus]
MEELFQEYINWPPESAIKIETIDKMTMTLQVPILKHRWPLFAESKEKALDIARCLTQEQLKAILLYAYSDLPAKRALTSTFQMCNLSHPQSLQQSTFVDDMRNLMRDRDSADFQLIAFDGTVVYVHRCILAARSKYFRSLFITESLEAKNGSWKSFKDISPETLQFFVEYVYTGQIANPSTNYIIPLCWLVKYLRLTGEKEVENIIVSALTRELTDDTQEALFEIAKEWEAKCVIDVIEKYSATRKC